MSKLVLFAEDSVEPPIIQDGSTTFIDNMKLPVHRWFRFSAGFSAEWVRSLIRTSGLRQDAVVLDPFAGSGTTLISCEAAGVKALGIEAHPFVMRVAEAKLCCHSPVSDFRRLADAMMGAAQSNGNREIVNAYPKLIHQCFPDDVLAQLDALRCAWEEADDYGSSAHQLAWLALTSSLRASSPVGTSQMELVQPKKKKAKVLTPMEAFQGQVLAMCHDMRQMQLLRQGPRASVIAGDARDCGAVNNDSIDFVITSPPYANNFDYADATRLEMSFWGEVGGWADLQDKVRKHLVRSCSQHASAEKLDLHDLLSEPCVAPISAEMANVCEELAEERLLHGGKKQYHLMVAAYFTDMAKVWSALRRVCRQGAKVCFVVGDSAPYGVYVPVHNWLGELAVAAGFESFFFEKTRDRNIKWKNRKHRVPLLEGRLWVQG